MQLACRLWGPGPCTPAPSICPAADCQPRDILQERAQLAAYAHIPLGNMGPDWELAAADALFGRCLRDAKHLLWARDASLPPLSQLPALAEEDATQLEPPAMDVSPPGSGL